MQISKLRIAITAVALCFVLAITSLGIARAISQLGTVAGSVATVPLSATATNTPSQSATASATTTAVTDNLWLSVRGTHIYAASGKPMILIGASRSSLEYSCAGDGHYTPADFQAMRSWGMNVVRIPLSSEFWGDSSENCPGYHQTVALAIQNAEQVGLYVILDLQWNAPFDTAYDRTYGGAQCPLPDGNQDVRFWKDLATAYGNDPRVLFDLLGEPHDVTWNQWLYGGSMPSSLCFLIGTSGGVEPVTQNYQAIGMVALSAMVRAIAPRNIIILGGLNWGYDLAGIDFSKVIHGQNIVFDTHPFDHSGDEPANWATSFGSVARKYPVIVGEFGSYSCQTSYISQAIGYFNALHLSWMAWTWNVWNCSGPGLIASWDGTPTSPYGAYIRAQMLAIAQQNP